PPPPPRPIVVVRGVADPAAPVLLGVDGSSANGPAVGFAFEEAARRAVPLVAMHAWTHPAAPMPDGLLPPFYDADDMETEEARVLAEALAGWRDKYPDVVVRPDLRCAGARKALIE